MRLKTNPAAGLIHDELEARGISISQAAEETGLPAADLAALCERRQALSLETALKIGAYLGCDPALLLRLQADFDSGTGPERFGRSF